jgi:hypothetical protein
METQRPSERIVVTLAGLLAGAGTALAYKHVLRPWHLSWGATDDEVVRPLPGDELVPEAIYESTRAVTIHAPSSQVWPWLLQIGQGRGGFYSYEWLENLIGARIRNADRILPDHQILETGDEIFFAAFDRYGDYSRSTVAVLEPERALVLGPPDDPVGQAAARFTGEGTWAFVLDPIDEYSTRLIVRTRTHAWGSHLLFLLFDPAHFVMERKMLLGIKARAEGAWAARGRGAALPSDESA